MIRIWKPGKQFRPSTLSIFMPFWHPYADWRLAAKRNAEVVALTQEMEACIPDMSRNGELSKIELRDTMERFLEGLPKETRLIFLRRYLYLDTTAEIAARYGISESKVKTQLHRTRAKLRSHLAKEGIRV